MKKSLILIIGTLLIGIGLYLHNSTASNTPEASVFGALFGQETQQQRDNYNKRKDLEFSQQHAK